MGVIKRSPLLLGYYHDNSLQYAGRVGTGFDEDLLKWLYQKMQPLKKNDCPFETFSDNQDDITWLKPKLVAEVGFTEWTSSGKLRHPRFLGLRKDKKAREVRREKT